MTRNRKTSDDLNGPITTAEVVRWFQAATPRIRQVGPCPVEKDCIGFTKYLNAIRQATITENISLFGAKLHTANNKAKNRKSRDHDRERTSAGKNFLTALTKQIELLQREHRHHLFMRTELPELSLSENSQYSDEIDTLREIIEVLEKSKAVWQPQTFRQLPAWYGTASMIADKVIEAWTQCGKPRRSLDPAGPTIRVVGAALFRTLGKCLEPKAIQTGIEKYRKKHRKKPGRRTA